MQAFVKPGKRERYLHFLSNPRLRHQFTRQLAHFGDADPRYRVPIPSHRQFADKIAIELQKRRSPQIVHAISEDPSLDERDLPLVEALQRVVGRGMGTVLSCMPGRLAYLETEDERVILERHDPQARPTYIRFVVGYKNENSHLEQGIFQAAWLALEERYVTGADAEELHQVQHWFNENLERPSSFGRDTLPLGICWFKDSSTAHIAQIWKMVDILERNGVYVKKIRTSRPGYVVYEDELQIVAEPYREGPRPR